MTMLDVDSALFTDKPELVMFDLDGTLVDSVPDLTLALDAVLREQGCPAAGEERTRLWVGSGASILVLRGLADALSMQPEQVDADLHEHCLQSFLRHYDHCNGRQSRLYVGVREALEYLQAADISMAVITNKPSVFVPHLLSSLGIENYFQMTLGGDELVDKKPHPAPLTHVLSKLGVGAEQALMVGDSRNDILAAKAAGVACLAVSYGYNHGRPVKLEQPEWLTDNLFSFFSEYL